MNILFRLPSSNRRVPLASLTAMLAATLTATQAWGAQEKAGAPAHLQEPRAKVEFVGSTTCQGCHEDIYNAFQKNPHQVVESDERRGFANNACESCHGPGSKHAESMSGADIRNPLKLRPAEVDKNCLTCHVNQATQAGRINGSHAKNQVSCVSCHSIHRNGPAGLVSRRAPEVNALCGKCHRDAVASFQKPYKHPVSQGAMSCVDCHNPHGSILARSIRTADANEPGCVKCHGDKRGPYVFEHAPLKLDGCTACHQPHGSANPHMLTRAQVRFVCLECHANLPGPAAPANGTVGTVPPALHDLRSPRFQNCTLCHQKVHGSNVNRDFFR